LAAVVYVLSGADTLVTVNVTDARSMPIGLVLNAHRPVASVTHVTALLQPPLHDALMVAPAIGRSSAP